MTATRTITPDMSGPASRRRVGWRTDLSVVPAAVAAALLTWWVVASLTGVDLVAGSRAVGGADVAVAAALAALGGVLLRRLLDRTTRRAGGVWSAIAALVLLVSLLGPLGAATPAATWSLAGLHVVVAAVVAGGLALSRRPAPR